MGVKQQRKRRNKQKKGTTVRCPQCSSSPLCCRASCCRSRCRSSPPFIVLLVCWSLQCCWVRVLVTASRGRAGAGCCFAGSCCCRSSLLVVVADGCGCWSAAVLFLFVAAALFKIYYRVGSGQPNTYREKNKKGRYSTFPAILP